MKTIRAVGPFRRLSGFAIRSLIVLSGLHSTCVLAQPLALPTPYSSTVTSSATGFSVSNSGSGNGLSGSSTYSTGVVASSSSGTNPALYASNSGSGYGVWGVSTYAAGVYGNSANHGIYGSTTATAEYGVYGENTYTGGFTGYGVYGFATKGIGVYGTTADAEAGVEGEIPDYDGNAVAAIYGYNASTNGSGLYGYGPDGLCGNGVTFTGSPQATIGVYGKATQNNTAAIYGQSAGLTNNYAGYFAWDVHTTGDVIVGGNLITPTGKQFLADDPRDPGNKFLRHASIESNEIKNLYDGTVTTDSNGLATVKLPTWFEALNTDFRYHLTVIGDFAKATIHTPIKDGKFVIISSKPNQKISWQVTGNRHDPEAKTHPLVVEESKSEDQKNKYLDPVAFGLPESAGIYNSQRSIQNNGVKPPAF